MKTGFHAIRRASVLAGLAACLSMAGALALSSCSSAPKKAPPGIFDARNEAARYVDLGAKALREGSSKSAAGFYAEAYRIYTAVDDAEGRVRALDGLGRLAVPGAAETKELLWERAQRIAAESGNGAIIAVASLLTAELMLQPPAPPGGGVPESDAERLKEALRLAEAAAAALEKQGGDKARALRIAGSAAKGLGDYQGALERLAAAARLDEKARAYIAYASDRFIAASVHSKAGDYAAAEAALMDALENDRRAEHAAGIGGDYLALALVAEKAGRKDQAIAYYKRAADTYSAARMETEAANVDTRREALEGR